MRAQLLVHNNSKWLWVASMIKLLCVGTNKDKHMVALQKDFEKRIQPFHKLEVIEVKEANPSFEESKIIESEGDALLAQIKPTDYVVLIDLHGKQRDSIEFSYQIENWLMNNSTLVFVIGGSLGMSNRLRDRSQDRICLSQMTFPHLLVRIMVLEQIYRSYKIINNQKYHK